MCLTKQCCPALVESGTKMKKRFPSLDVYSVEICGFHTCASNCARSASICELWATTAMGRSVEMTFTSPGCMSDTSIFTSTARAFADGFIDAPNTNITEANPPKSRTTTARVRNFFLLMNPCTEINGVCCVDSGWLIGGELDGFNVTPDQSHRVLSDAECQAENCEGPDLGILDNSYGQAFGKKHLIHACLNESRPTPTCLKRLQPVS